MLWRRGRRATTASYEPPSPRTLGPAGTSSKDGRRQPMLGALQSKLLFLPQPGTVILYLHRGRWARRGLAGTLGRWRAGLGLTPRSMPRHCSLAEREGWWVLVAARVVGRWWSFYQEVVDGASPPRGPASRGSTRGSRKRTPQRVHQRRPRCLSTSDTTPGRCSPPWLVLAQKRSVGW